MTMTNEEMFDAVETLASINETGKLGYAVARNLRKLKDSCKEYTDMRDEVFKKYGTDIEGVDNARSITREVFDRELGDIKSIEHDVEIFTVPEAVFTSGSLTSHEMEKLLWMVSE